jgi:hypothetical protein
MEYVCKENNICIIDVSRRNQCQACRLRKCLEVKMNRDGKQIFVLFYVYIDYIRKILKMIIKLVSFLSKTKLNLRFLTF